MHNLLKILGLPVSSKTPVPAFGKMYNCCTIGKFQPLCLRSRQGQNKERSDDTQLIYVKEML